MAKGLELEARLVISRGADAIQIAASGTYLIVNIPSQRVLDELTSPSKGTAPKPAAAPGAPNALQQLNMLALRLGLVLDLRVAGKTYVTFGTGPGPKITFNAVLGKIGSFFRRE